MYAGHAEVVQVQLSGNAAQEELERFADVRAAALLLPVIPTRLVMHFLPTGTCALCMGLHGSRHCKGVVVAMTVCLL